MNKFSGLIQHVFLLLFALILVIPLSLTAQFTDINASLEGIYCQGNATSFGDFDNDGDLDILLTGYTGTTFITRIYRNDGNGIFIVINAGLIGVSGGSVVWGDYDNDGDLDILLTGSYNDGTDHYISKIYRNDGNNVFIEINAGLTGVESGSAAWGDYDNDGDLDILITGYTGNTSISRIYRNNGNGTFTDMSIGLIGVSAGSTVWGDYDNDGDLDILLTGYYNDGTYHYVSKIYRNDSNGIFTDINAALTPVIQSSAIWGDYDNDGDLDILIAGVSETGKISRVYRNDNNIFTNINANLTGVINSSVAWGDYNNDGYLDILLAGYNGTLYVTRLYNNDGNGSFSETSIDLPGISGTVVLADYDNDTDLDILLTGQSEGGPISKIYRNDYNIVNTNPSCPTNLRASIEGAYIKFAWDASIDSQTPSLGLNYSLRIGTIPGGCDILSPMSKANGKLLMPKRGDINSSCSWKILRNALPEHYYWCVQAIDCAFSGSAFSEEAIGGLFIDINAGLIGISVSSSDWGDYDNDGDLDILLTGYGESSPISKIYRNDGMGSFTDINADLLGVAWSSAVWGDYDNDGDLDILLTGYHPDSSSQEITKIYRNDNNSIFTDINANIPGFQVGSADWGDYDNDGDLDILLTGAKSGIPFTKIYQNDGNNSFIEIYTDLPNVWLSCAVWGDYDNDGDLDILLTGYTGTGGDNHISRVYRNDHGLFTDINAGLIGICYSSAAWGDYDNDGDLDIAFSGSIENGYVSKIYQNNHGVFTDIHADLDNLTYGSIAWGDFDNDGDLDLLLSGNTGEINSLKLTKVYRNEGNNIFHDINVNLTRVSRSSLVWGDYDNDGDLDILLTGDTGNSGISTVYRNDCNIINNRPLAPTNLRTSIESEYVDFTWDKSTDDHTPNLGLNYVLKIGNNPGESQISGPMSNSVGTRQIARNGYSNLNCSWKIKKSVLANQNEYYWSVQSIDSSLKGSNFAQGTVVYVNFISVLTSYSINCGIAYLGSQSVPQNIWLKNTGTVPLIIDSLNFKKTSHLFAVEYVSLPLVISTGDSSMLSVRFIPQSTGTFSDSIFIFNNSSNIPRVAIKLSGIGQLVPPKSPTDITLNIQNNDAVISWNLVTQTIFDTPLIPDCYLVFVNGTSNPEGGYSFLGISYTTSFTHFYAAMYAPYMFYRVIAFKNYSRGGIEDYHLRIGMSEEEVSRRLTSIKN
jgi:hypothetical protein